MFCKTVLVPLDCLLCRLDDVSFSGCCGPVGLLGQVALFCECVKCFVTFRVCGAVCRCHIGPSDVTVYDRRLVMVHVFSVPLPWFHMCSAVYKGRVCAYSTFVPGYALPS